MIDITAWAFPAALVFFLVGTLLVLYMTRRGRPVASDSDMEQSTAQERICSVCRQALIFDRSELEPLIHAEMALAVSADPSLIGKKLAEYVCPYCDAAHCFVVDGADPTWVGANFSEPQDKGRLCLECRTPLRTPSWAKGAYDGNLDGTPQQQADHGLVCRFCKSICCLQCCEANTRNRTQDGSLLCPRCFRGPMNQFFHP
jgi:hypothetical protein